MVTCCAWCAATRRSTDSSGDSDALDRAPQSSTARTGTWSEPQKRRLISALQKHCGRCGMVADKSCSAEPVRAHSRLKCTAGSIHAWYICSSDAPSTCLSNKRRMVQQKTRLQIETKNTFLRSLKNTFLQKPHLDEASVSTRCCGQLPRRSQDVVHA